METEKINAEEKVEKGKKKRVYIVLMLIMWAVFLLGCVSVYTIFKMIADGKVGYMPPIEDLENPKNKFASEIYSSDMKVLGRYSTDRGNRVWVDYNQLSPYLVKALIATEDIRYASHSGIDEIGLIRAVVKRGILQQKNAGGGSTITQQLAKQLYSPTADNIMERMFQKPIEWVIAVQLERLYTKEEIVAMYLNKFDFLNNAVGIKTAAQVYFDTTPAELKVEEAATLIGMCKNPSYFNPVRRNERTKGRRNVVLDQMVKAGMLSKADGDSLKELPLVLKYNKVDHKEGIAPYFREYLRVMMRAKKPVKKSYASWQTQKYYEDSLAWETNPLYGWCNKNKKPNGEYYDIATDGLKIFTTIDSRMQQYAEEAVREHVAMTLQPKFTREKKNKKTRPFTHDLTEREVEMILRRAMKVSDRYRIMKKSGHSEKEIEAAFNEPVEMRLFSYDGVIDTTMTPMDSIRYQKTFLRVGFMSMDPRTGHVKAYVGGPDFRYFQYDMAMVGRRQVGSTIKPFLYTFAMENGFSPCDEVQNVQRTYFDANGKPWVPRNSSKKNIGDIVTLKWGLANSNNWISAYLMDKLSPEGFVSLLHSFGIKNKIDPVISLCLGPCEVSVGEMVSAYTAFANKGVRCEPFFVTRIEDNRGNIIANFTPEVYEVFSEETSYKMLSMLRAVIDQGTGGRIRRIYNIKAPMGGKTGTTQNNSDAWFMGFTPSLVSGVWVGGEERDIHFDRMVDGQGAAMALPVWGIYMNKVYADKELGYSQEEDFEVPEMYQNPCTTPDPVSDGEEVLEYIYED